jgi:hypothetical protein
MKTPKEYLNDLQSRAPNDVTVSSVNLAITDSGWRDVSVNLKRGQKRISRSDIARDKPYDDLVDTAFQRALADLPDEVETCYCCGQEIA